jgi:hypothetical protein
MSVRGNPETSATLRKAALVATGQPGNLLCVPKTSSALIS